jgi:hypothetical protein
VIEKAAQHPGCLLVDLHTLGEQMSRGLVVCVGRGGKEFPRRADYRFLACEEITNHVGGVALTVVLGDAGQSRELAVAAGSFYSQGPDAFCDEIDG